MKQQKQSSDDTLPDIVRRLAEARLAAKHLDDQLLLHLVERALGYADGMAADRLKKARIYQEETLERQLSVAT